MFPRQLAILLDYEITGNPLYRGGFAGVWKGQYRGQNVAAKVLRLRSKDDAGQIRRVSCWSCSRLEPLFITNRISQRFCRAVVVWSALHHEDVLPLLGVMATEDRLVMVSEWMVGGNIMEFVKVNVNADRLGLVRFSFKV